MLTDFHVHLRPDSFPSEASEYFTPGNADRYREAAAERGIELLGVAEHVHRFTQALEVWRHPWWERNAVDDLDAYCSFVREETDLKLGIEADFVAGREDRMANLLEARDWDYVVGSVHFLRDSAVDMDEWDVWESGDPEQVWRRYFETLGEAARTGMFDILAHPDLVKVWGKQRPRTGGRPSSLLRSGDGRDRRVGRGDRGVHGRAAKAGRRDLPAPAFLEMCLEAGRPVALSSDAHVPDQLGHRYDEAVEMLRSVGVSEIADFERRQRRMVPLG